MRRWIACVVFVTILLTGCSANIQIQLSSKLAEGILDAASQTAKPNPESTLEQAGPAPDPVKTPSPDAATEYQGPPYILRVGNFSAVSTEYGTVFPGDGTYIDSYLYDGSVTVQFGRFAPVINSDEALNVIAGLVPINRDMLELSNGFCGSYPACWLQYTSGSSEDTQVCRDLVVFADDALHWFHCSVYADQFEECALNIEYMMDAPYLVELTEPQLLALKPGDANYILAHVQYEDETTALVDDLFWINGDDEATLAQYNIPIDQVANDYAIVNIGDEQYHPFAISDKGKYSAIFYDEMSFAQTDCTFPDFLAVLEKRSTEYGVQAMLANVCFAGDTIISIEEQYIP